MHEEIIEKLNNECEIRNLSPRTSFINTKREYSVFYKAGMNRTKGL
ncbi:hypothetical protein SAMN02910369_02770 [Lachnospiraceae bacterium NE2001]|nr:hypothetical protein SAMN02910369_02770 [Lachnospiraceae bacterium NE2001]